MLVCGAHPLLSAFSSQQHLERTQGETWRHEAGRTRLTEVNNWELIGGIRWGEGGIEGDADRWRFYFHLREGETAGLTLSYAQTCTADFLWVIFSCNQNRFKVTRCLLIECASVGVGSCSVSPKHCSQPVAVVELRVELATHTETHRALL